MKAIYINLDPYLQAVADWLNAGATGTVPCFDPLPVAVTIPLGETAAIFLPSGGDADTDPGDSPNTATVSGQSLQFWELDDAIPEDAIATKIVPGLSALAPSAKYWAQAVTGDVSGRIRIVDGEGENPVTVPFTVLVRRETASGPVDLVDFTPPLSLAGVSFAGVDIEGAEFDGNEIVADESTGALSAPAAGG